MTDPRARRMAPVLDMALEEERKAARTLGECQRQLEDAGNRLRDLEHYASEYEKGWTQRCQRVESLRKLIERYREEARARADKQEQKLLDELTQRLFSHRSSSNE